jgi:hypothetical protein
MGRVAVVQQAKGRGLGLFLLTDPCKRIMTDTQILAMVTILVLVKNIQKIASCPADIKT